MKFPLLPLMLAVLMCPLAAATPASAEAVESPAARDARMAWWREARFGLFIHWGLYAQPAGIWKGEKIPGIGEWIHLRAKIPVAEYAALARDFNPVDFDADAWVRLAKAAGMKYIIITSKHHDGFALFDTAASDFDIVDATPFKRDVLRELADACARHGMRLGFYYSQAQDWHHPGGAASGGSWDPAQHGSMDDYLRDIAYPQVKELLTKYGPVSVLWWDTPTGMTPERAQKLFPLTELQPGLITNNRLGGGFLGDTETPENRVPATGYPRDWEACLTMNDTWGFKSWDENWKSTEQLIRTLVDIASKGGNLLLNVGPDARGRIPAPSVERLQAIGRWLERNGEAIYGTTASPFLRLGWGRATRKGDRLYVHVFDWPQDGRLVVPMRGQPRTARLLHGTGTVRFTSTPAGLELRLPGAAPDPIASVIVLEGVDDIGPLPPPPISPDADGVLNLTCDEATLSGGIRVAGNTNLNIADWRKTDAAAVWQVQVPADGEYEVSLLAQYNARSQDAAYRLTAEGESLAGSFSGPVGDQYVTRPLGRLKLAGGRPVNIRLEATALPQGEFVAVRALRLLPVATAR